MKKASRFGQSDMQTDYDGYNPADYYAYKRAPSSWDLAYPDELYNK